MYNHNKAQQSKNRVHISWDILYAYDSNKLDEWFLEQTRAYIVQNKAFIYYCVLGNIK